jgi:hypothetical protein
MKVRDLIKKLETLPPHLEVVAGTYDALPIIDAIMCDINEENILCEKGHGSGKLVVAFCEGVWKYDTNIFED